MTIVGVLDTSLESTNDGDSIIVEAVHQNFPILNRSVRFPTHRRLTRVELLAATKCDILVVTGTNIVTSKMLRDRQWPLGLAELRAFQGKLVMLGVGWRQYQDNPGMLRTRILRSLIADSIAVSARDQYTCDKLNRLGINAVNTGCPTTWLLPESISRLGDVDECVFTLTDYNPDPAVDGKILKHLSETYKNTYVWPQSAGDLKTIRKMWLPRNVSIADRGLPALDKLLPGKDYIGTRLHAGIRAAQHGSAVLVVAVDNRANEIGRDTGLPVTDRRMGMPSIVEAINRHRGEDAHLELATQSIALWKNRFHELAAFAGSHRSTI